MPSKNEEKVYAVLREMFPYLTIAREHPVCADGNCDKALRRTKIDFFIKELELAIEVDGEHHFRRVEYDDYQKAQAQFERRVALDNLKEQQIRANGWKLIRISYKELRKKDYKQIIKNKINEVLEGSE